MFESFPSVSRRLLWRCTVPSTPFAHHLQEGTMPPRLYARPLSFRPSRMPLSGSAPAPMDDNVVRVKRLIVCYSHLYSPAEWQYSTTEREAMAVCNGLVKFLSLIEGHQLLVVTD